MASRPSQSQMRPPTPKSASDTHSSSDHHRESVPPLPPQDSSLKSRTSTSSNPPPRRTPLSFLRRSKSGDPVRKMPPVVASAPPKLPDVVPNGSGNTNNTTGFPRHLLGKDVRDSADILAGNLDDESLADTNGSAQYQHPHPHQHQHPHQYQHEHQHEPPQSLQHQQHQHQQHQHQHQPPQPQQHHQHHQHHQQHQQHHQQQQQPSQLGNFVPGRKSTDSVIGPAGEYVRSSSAGISEDPYANIGSMAHRGRYSYASSAVSTVNSPRRVRRRKDPTPFKFVPP